MGKIVKYCAKCEESFSEKFSFCPNCASEMTAYEMNPLMAETKAPEPESVKVFEPAQESVIETAPIEAPVAEKVIEPEPPIFLTQNSDEDILEFADDDEEEETVIAPTVAVAAPIVASTPIVEEEEIAPPPTVATRIESIPVVAAPIIAPTNVEDYQRTYNQETPNFASKATGGTGYQSTASNKKLDDDGFFNVTLVEPKNAGTRTMLLLGAGFLVMALSFGGLIFSIFNNNAYVGGLEDDLNNIVFVGEDIPTEVEEPEKPKAKEDKEAGGGGGGNEDPTPVSKGRIPDLVKNPDVPPSTKMDQVTNPELKLNVGVKNEKDVRNPPSSERYGDPNSKYDTASDGPGSGGGGGGGRNGGWGGGEGPGLNYGKNGGPGGNGPGGPGGRRTPEDDDEPPPTPRPAGPTVAMSITSKPRANYTDAARTNQVQGTVTLRVTFNANGTIGNISPVNSLPYGLTEQAIAAARNIRFTPQQKGGVPQTVIKQVQYNFTLY